MKLFAFAMLSLVPSVTVCSVFSKEVDIYSGTYGNDDVEVFQPEEVTYHLAGRDGVFYEGAFTFDNYNPDKGGTGNRQGVFSGYRFLGFYQYRGYFFYGYEDGIFFQWRCHFY